MQTPESIDRAEDKRVRDMLAEARANHVTIRQSKEKVKVPATSAGSVSSKNTRRRYSGLSLGYKRLGFSSSISLGDAVRKDILDREHIAAQHGPVKVLWKNGKPVPKDEQSNA